MDTTYLTTAKLQTEKNSDLNGIYMYTHDIDLLHRCSALHLKFVALFSQLLIKLIKLWQYKIIMYLSVIII